MSDTTFLPHPVRALPGPRPAPKGAAGPTIRIPVTRANRARLRHLRALELGPWIDSGLASHSPTSKRSDPPAPDRESQVIVLVLATAALAMLVQSTPVVAAFLDRWGIFRDAVALWVR